MEKKCEVCGAILTLKNICVYEDKHLCKNCFDKIELEEDISVLAKRNQDLSSDSHKYPALHTISAIYKILAIIIGIASFIGLFWGLSQLDSQYTKGVGLITTVYSLIVGFIAVITLLAISEGIKLFIDIEGNTRATNKLLSKNQ
jgi:hypothetical protein